MSTARAFGTANRRRTFRDALTSLLSPAAHIPSDRVYSRTAIAAFFDVQTKRDTSSSDKNNPACHVDDISWQDLMLDEYLDKISAQASLFGRQQLYRQLRCGLDESDRKALQQRIQGLLKDPEATATLLQHCQALRHAETDVTEVLFDPLPSQKPAWANYLNLLPLGLFVSALAGVFYPICWIISLACVYCLISLQLQWSGKMHLWQTQLHSLQHLLHAHFMLSASEATSPYQDSEQNIDNHKLGQQLQKQFRGRQWLQTVPGLNEYANWLLQANLKHYFKTRQIAYVHQSMLQSCYRKMAKIDAELCLARHLNDASNWCFSETAPNIGIQLSRVIHPLLKDASAISLDFRNSGAFISGQNASGKSTLLRCIGLNLLVARAFGFCYAESACLPAVPVFTSMQNEDSLLDGTSLYLAELQRAKSLLAHAQSRPGAVYLIDEIFRGTNHLEAVAAAAAVLEQLSEHGLVIVTSHHVILADILAERLRSYFVHIDAKNVRQLSAGKLPQTNGLSLLSSQEFDVGLIERARHIHQILVQTQYFALTLKAATHSELT